MVGLNRIIIYIRWRRSQQVNFMSSVKIYKNLNKVYMKHEDLTFIIIKIFIK